MWLDERSLPRQVHIPEARQPKPECCSALHRRKQLVFGESQRPGPLISTKESGGSLDIVAAGEALDAPVVEAHRYIEQKRVATGEIEINHTGQAPLLEQHVVAEEIGVNRP